MLTCEEVLTYMLLVTYMLTYLMEQVDMYFMNTSTCLLATCQQVVL